jgi:hypothetical protein
MSETKNTQNTMKSFVPFNVDEIPGIDTWKKLADEGLSRYVSWLDDMAKLQKNGFEQLTKTIDERSKMLNESLAYAQKLTSEWQKMTVETTKKVVDMVKPQN